MVAALRQTFLPHQLVDQQTAGGLMNAHANCQVADPDSRVALDFLENPHLGTGQTTTLLDQTEMLAQGAKNQAALLQHFHCQRRRWGIRVRFQSTHRE